MSAFTPTQWTLQPPDRPDNLSAAVLHSLSRPLRGLMAWGPLKSFVLGALTFGILPLIAWPRRFRKFVVVEQRQLWHLVEWLRVRTGDADAAKLRNSLRDAGAMPTLWIIPAIMLIVLAWDFFPWLNPFEFHRFHVYRMAYHAGHWLNRPLRPFVWVPDIRWDSFNLHTAWVACLSIAFASHWLHIQLHVSQVNALLRRLNPILQRQHLPPMAQYGVGLGLRPFWLLAGLIGAVFGAWWAIPAALAGAVQQRYCRRTGDRIRSELALRVGSLLLQQRPAIDVPLPHGFRVVCSNPLCGKTIPGPATFCPRCGTRLPSNAG